MDFQSFAVSLAYATRAFGLRELPGERFVDQGLVQCAKEASRAGLAIDDVPDDPPDEEECPLVARYWGEDIADIENGKVRFMIGGIRGSRRLAQIGFQCRVKDKDERAILQRMAPRLFDIALSALMGKNNGHVVEGGIDIE